MPANLPCLTEYDVRMMRPSERLERATIVELPYSEVCCHMRVAGEHRPVIDLGNGMAWILNHDGITFSFPVTRGEAGLHG